MARITLNQWVKKYFRRPQSTRKARNFRRTPSFEQLGTRIMPAVNAFFTAGHLTILGDAHDNTIVVSRDTAGTLQVNGGAVKVHGGTPTVANVAKVHIFGLGGNDTLSLDESNGALPSANIFGGSGNDTLIGGSAADILFGQAGNDTLLGKSGDDQLFGGAGNDVLTGGSGVDRVFGEAGNDRMIWNPGDGSDLNNGGSGIDTVEVNGGIGSEAFLATVINDHILFERVDPAPFAIDIVTSESLVLNMNGGDDTFFANGNIAGLIVDGGAGEDTIVGGAGNDLLIGGDGNDFIDGNQGIDRALLGAGDDFFRWDPGDGSDTVEGQAGTDTMLFNGSGQNEIFDLSANGGRLRFFRDLGNIVMDTDDVEVVDLNALGGSDNITVNDLSGTDVVEFNIDLAGVLEGAAGDGLADTVIINGTNGDDVVVVAGDASGVAVLGLAAHVNISNAEAAFDRLVVNAVAGDDAVDASGLAANGIQLTADGGDNDDELIGGAGNDTIRGGNGNDVLIGGPGIDILDGGPGDNIVIQD